MVLFKINGERNSGTNFLSRLLIANNFPCYDQLIEGNIVYNWKHGIPTNDVKLKNECVVDIFIFRNLEEWLVSMSQNAYHLKRKDNFLDFLVTPQESSEVCLLDYRTNRCLNEDDNNKNIFEIRYYKLHKIFEYQKSNKNVVYVNLTYLQNEANALCFLKALHCMYPSSQTQRNENQTYGTKIITHTKTGEKTINRVYNNINLSDYQNIINKYKNSDDEQFINELTFVIN
jgi:hypothetical protein